MAPRPLEVASPLRAYAAHWICVLDFTYVMAIRRSYANLASVICNTSNPSSRLFVSPPPTLYLKGLSPKFALTIAPFDSSPRAGNNRRRDMLKLGSAHGSPVSRLYLLRSASTDEEYIPSLSPFFVQNTTSFPSLPHSTPHPTISPLVNGTGYC
ncbi:hypothetical protein K491DRAFT_280959 [Lophiostoma macrostomum CBS 122681]|uniref:Uncharacterized protein n=1 Tax=Lophiostoma macrostomum CBS 122681 TaxID=1314788 RepID=A0A6A6TQR3_9PLEO|nr:hypothetical protein K491DRAFT_280959 [Lophiostoma macrostomum CBS 122681]